MLTKQEKQAIMKEYATKEGNKKRKIQCLFDSYHLKT